MDESLWSYEKWSDRLAAFFFKESDAGLPTTFSVDERALGKLTDLSPVVATEQLSQVVRERIMPGFRFEAVAAESLRWQRFGAEGAPPALPLLAMSVLAASKMGSDFHHLDFYRPFRRLLDPKDSLSGMPRGFDDCFPKLWEQLKWWLDEHLGGSRGVSTVYRHEHWTLIGYSLQQAIFRTSDRRRVQQFLASTGFRAGDDFEATELRRSLRIWSSRRGSDADRLRRLSTDENLRPYCEELLAHIASTWDGTLRDVVSGMPVSKIRLNLERRGIKPKLSAVATWDDRMPNEVNVVIGGVGVDLRQLEQKYFEPVPLPNVEIDKLLQDDAAYSGSFVTLQFELNDLYALSVDDDLGGWTTVDNVNYGETYCLLVNLACKGLLPSLQKFYESETSRTLELKPELTRHLFNWLLVTNFRLEARPEQPPPVALAHLLRTGGGSRLGLVGGLPLSQQRRLYLSNGAPLLALPAEYDSPNFVVRKRNDGQEMSFQVQPGNEYPLYSLALQPGGYDVEIDNGVTSFDIVEGIAERHRVDEKTLDVDGFSVSGASHSRPIGVRLAGENGSCVLLGAVTEECVRVSSPTWIQRRAGELSWIELDAWVDFEPVWKIETQRGNWVAHPIGSSKPKIRTAGTSVSTSFWARCIRQSELVAGCDVDDQNLWDQYVHLAEGRSA